MFKEKYTSTPNPSESAKAANDTQYNETNALESLSPEELHNRKKALLWLIGKGNGQNEAQRAEYQAELDRIKIIEELQNSLIK